MRCCYFTHRGKVRRNNEDALLVGSLLVCVEEMEKVECLETEDRLFCVADGMGGHEKGEVASRITLQTLLELKPSSREELLKAIHIAKDRLEEYVKVEPSAYGMGCALAGVLLLDDKALVFNVGDCRVYKVFKDRLFRLSRDHSVVEELVLEGVISREEAKSHPQRHVITSAITGDHYSTELRIYEKEIKLYEGDRFLICSDGLWEEYEEPFDDPQKLVEFLFKEGMLLDNISFILLEVGNAQVG